jgi:single-stranded-DNA-specific exonuclease
MRWVHHNGADDRTSALIDALRANPAFSRADAASVLPILAPLLVHRGFREPEAAAKFLAPSVSHLHSPDQMTGLRAAVDRIDAAIERREPMLIYGDYDVDGTMAVIILKTAIELCGGAADFHVPHRIREGYDLRDDVIERAAAVGIRLIVSVDMGIRAWI